MRFRGLTVMAVLAALGLGATACGDDGGGSGAGDGEGNAKVVKEEHEATGPSAEIEVVDEETGLKAWFYKDSFYLEFTGDTPAEVKSRLEGKFLQGECRPAEGAALDGINAPFLIHWREDSGDWGSAEVRLPARQPFLAEGVGACDISGADGKVTTVEFRS
jgi:hypothetical protein